MIAICDIKYTIIPDQLTILLGALGLIISVYDIVRGFGLLHASWWSPLAGAAMGAGVMIIIDLIGMLVYKKDGMGFGDVKLFAAVGIITGFPGTILAFIISMITAMVCFCVILIAMRIVRSKADAQEKAADIEDPARSEKLPAENAEQTQTEEETGKISCDAAQDGEKETAGCSDEQTAEENGEEAEAAGSYLAFGPYIALSLICYLVFNDFIYHMVDLYLKLF